MGSVQASAERHTAAENKYIRRHICTGGENPRPACAHPRRAHARMHPPYLRPPPAPYIPPGLHNVLFLSLARRARIRLARRTADLREMLGSEQLRPFCGDSVGMLNSGPLGTGAWVVPAMVFGRTRLGGKRNENSALLDCDREGPGSGGGTDAAEVGKGMETFENGSSTCIPGVGGTTCMGIDPGGCIVCGRSSVARQQGSRLQTHLRAHGDGSCGSKCRLR